MTGSLRRERERARKTSKKGPAVPRRAFLIERFKGRWSTLFGATTIEEEEEEQEEEEEKEVEEEAEEVMTEDEGASPIATGLTAAGADDALLIARLRRSRMLTSRRRSRG